MSHHLNEYLDKFTTLNPSCCDPFEHHADKENSREHLGSKRNLLHSENTVKAII